MQETLPGPPDTRIPPATTSITPSAHVARAMTTRLDGPPLQCGLLQAASTGAWGGITPPAVDGQGLPTLAAGQAGRGGRSSIRPHIDQHYRHHLRCECAGTAEAAPRVQPCRLGGQPVLTIPSAQPSAPHQQAACSHSHRCILGYTRICSRAHHQAVRQTGLSVAQASPEARGATLAREATLHAAQPLACACQLVACGAP